MRQNNGGEHIYQGDEKVAYPNIVEDFNNSVDYGWPKVPIQIVLIKRAMIDQTKNFQGRIACFSRYCWVS